MASLGEELLISADSHVIEDPHFWENRLPASFKDQAPVFPRASGGRGLSGTSRWMGPTRACEGDGGGWGERRGALSEFRPGPVRTAGRRAAGGVLPGLQRLDHGILLRRPRPPLRRGLHLHVRHRPRSGGAGALPDGRPARSNGVAGTAAGALLRHRPLRAPVGSGPGSGGADQPAHPHRPALPLAAPERHQAADARPSRPCAVR